MPLKYIHRTIGEKTNINQKEIMFWDTQHFASTVSEGKEKVIFSPALFGLASQEG
jgi:hypothetical protein